MRDTGAIIKSRRKELKLRQADVASAVGVDPVTVGFWERNIHKPKGENLMRLARKLGLRPEAIVDERALQESDIERQAELIRQAYLNSSEDLQAAVRRVLGTIEEIDSAQREEKH